VEKILTVSAFWQTKQPLKTEKCRIFPNPKLILGSLEGLRDFPSAWDSTTFPMPNPKLAIKQRVFE